jgi:putative MATE family efflux protein
VSRGVRRLEERLTGLAVPLIVNNILFTLMGFVDSLMVGQLGENTISAVGNAAQVQVFLFLLFAAIGQGGSILVAQAFGAKNDRALRDTASTIVASGFVIGALVGLATWFGGEAFLWLLTLGKGPEVVRLGTTYLRIVAFSYVFLVPGNMVSSVLRSVGDTKTPVKIAVVANLFNVAGNAVLIFGLGPFPALGYQGSAIATLIAQSAQGLVLLYFVTTAKSRLRLGRADLIRIDGPTLKKIVVLGYPMSIDGFWWQGARIAYTVIFNAIGSHAYAAYTIVRNFKGMATLPTSGLQTATMISVGQALGRGRNALAKVTARVGLRLSVALMTLPALLVVVLSGLLVGIYKLEPTTFHEAVICTMILGVSIFFTTVNSVIPGILRAGGDTVVVMKYTLLSFVFVGGPLAWILGVGLGGGTIGAFLGVSLEEVFKAWIFYRRMQKDRWLKKLA